MLGATENQLFQTTTTGTDAQGNPIQSITGFQPYQAYGGTYDANGNLTNPTQAAQAAVAGFQPLQTQAQQGIGALTGPQTYGQAMDMTNQGINQLGQNVSQAGQYGQAGYNAGMSYGQQATDPNAVASYMNPYIQNTLAPSMQLLNQQYGMQQAANQGAQTQAGAFGGSRGTLQNSLNQQNQMLAQNQLVGNAYNQAYNTANQNMQQAAQLGMAGAQQGLAGVQAQQAGINSGLAGAQQLSNLGQQQQTNQENIYNLQNQYGAQQQAYNQNVINQAMQNYANAQQYPIMELGTMSNMLRGLPMQATTTNQYQAQPSALSQAIGAAGVGATLSSLTKGSKKGGLQTATGINSYDIGGSVKAQLEDMPTDALQEELKRTQSGIVKADIQQILAMRAQSPDGMATAKQGGIMSIKRYAKSDDSISTDDNTSNGDTFLALNTPPKDKTSGRNIVTDTAPAPAQSMAAPGIANEGNAGEAEAANNMQGGINTVAPQPTAGPTPQQNQQLMLGGINQLENPTEKSMFAGQLNTINADMNKTDEQRVNEQKALYDKFMGPNTEMAEIAKQRANAQDEAERQRKLRFAQFLSTWGSTPGPALVAGIKASASIVPSLVADSDKQANIMQKLDEVAMQVNRADRLEKAGFVTRAIAEKKDAAARMDKLNDEVRRAVKAQEDNRKARELEAAKDAAALERTRIEAKSRVDAATIGRPSKDELLEDRINKRYAVASDQLRRANEDMSKVMSSKAYMDAANNYNAFASSTDPVKKLTAERYKDEMDQLLKAPLESQKTARENVELYGSKILGRSSTGASDDDTPKDTPKKTTKVTNPFSKSKEEDEEDFPQYGSTGKKDSRPSLADFHR
jgi:hypothetical protein